MIEGYRAELVRDLRTHVPDIATCNAAADEIEDMDAEIERLVDDKDDLFQLMSALIKIHEEASIALNTLTCAGKDK